AHPQLPRLMLGIPAFITFLPSGWHFSHQRPPRRMLEHGA
ncbi:hypothetical protein ACSRCF_22210, partial [Salmonella enterica]